MVRETASLWIRPPQNPIGSMTLCLWESAIRVGVFGLNLRLAPLILAKINVLQLRSSRALTGSVYADAGYIENRSVLGVMSRRKCHSSHMEKMVTQDTVLVLLYAARLSGYYDLVMYIRLQRLVTRHPTCASYGADTYPAPGLARDHPILDRNTQYHVYYA